MLPGRPAHGREVGQSCAYGDDHVRVVSHGVAGTAAGRADGAHVEGVVPGQGALARLCLGEGDAEAAHEAIERGLGLAVDDAPADHQHGPRGPGDELGGGGQRAFVRSLPGHDPGALLEQAIRPVPGLRLHVLRQGQGDRARVGWRGQHAHGLAQGIGQHLRPLDAVEVARHRSQHVVGADVPGLRSLQLLQHRLDAPRGETIARQQQHRQAVDGGVGSTGGEVGRTGADGGGAGERAQAPGLLGEGGRGVHHGLLVACLVVAHLALGCLERLADAGHDAVAEDAEDATEEAFSPAVPLDVLVG